MAEARPTLAVTNHDQRRKAEALAALDRLRHAIDVDELLDQFLAAIVAATAAAFVVAPTTIAAATIVAAAATGVGVL